MPSLDVFNSSHFSMNSLTQAINDLPYVPGRIGQLGIFEERGIRTTTAWVERNNETLSLVPVTERGAPPTQHDGSKRDVAPVQAVRLAIEDVITAEQVQNIRAFGSESEIKTVQSEVNMLQAEMARKLDATLEHHRIGAIKGIVLDSDGATEILDIYSLFGVSAPATVDFDLVNDAADVRGKCSGVIRSIEDALGGTPYQSIHAFCGSTFFDTLVQHPFVRDTYLYSEGSQLRERTARRSVFYGGITFEEYRGSVGGTDFVATGDARIFPVGAVGNFITRYAPADYMDTVNTMGLPRYSVLTPDPTGKNRYVAIESQTNLVNLCMRPLTLIRGTHT